MGNDCMDLYGRAFQGASNLTTFSATDTPDLSGVTSMRSMFSRTAL